MGAITFSVFARPDKRLQTRAGGNRLIGVFAGSNVKSQESSALDLEGRRKKTA
jgi:hypothetical protein